MPEQTEAQQETIEEIASPYPHLQPIVDIRLKEQEALKKKRRFVFLMTAVGILTLALIITPFAVRYYKQNFVKTKPTVQEIGEEEKSTKIEVGDPTSKVQYSSDYFELTVEFPAEAILKEGSEEESQIRKLEISYDKQNEQGEVTPENLNEGYILRISTFLTSRRNLDQITQVRKEAFVSECPQTSVISSTVGSVVGGMESRTFEVTNCNSDYKITYLVRNGINYEFTQIFKGDLGYRQVYKANTEEIMTSVKFYVEETTKGPTETYTNEKHSFSFEHPNFVSDCCDVITPIADKSNLEITLGDPDTLIDNNNFDGFGVSVDEKNRNISFDEYLEKQKKILTDDYIVVRGEAPKLENISIKIGDKTGTLLRGYSWRGYEIIYVDITKETGKEKFLVLSVKNMTGDDFEEKMDDIIKSFNFF